MSRPSRAGAPLQWVNGAQVATAYSIAVWNQGGAVKSDPLPNAFTILP